MSSSMPVGLCDQQWCPAVELSNKKGRRGTVGFSSVLRM